MGLTKAQPVGGDPNDGDDGGNDEDRAPCEWCKTKKLPCQMQAGKRSSIIWRPTTSKQQEGGTGGRIAIMESQMAQSLANLRALREANSKMHQYLRQLLRRQEDNHACLIAMETRMAMMGMEESEEEEEDEEGKGKEVEEKEKGMEEDGEGEGMEAEEEGEGEVPVKTAASEEGKEREVE
ncbi:hypothetical protein EV359DRAFT_88067 [Lentinula novae-zelandiae]|nr:hypothetical protein EV359DRAFT_88067 [Lentinula novae-zelandiae]